VLFARSELELVNQLAKLDDGAAWAFGSIFDVFTPLVRPLVRLLGGSCVAPAAAQSAVLGGKLGVDHILVEAAGTNAKYHSLEVQNLLCTEARQRHVPVLRHGNPSKGHVASNPVALRVRWVSSMRCKLIRDASGNAAHNVLFEVIAEIEASIPNHDVRMCDRGVLMIYLRSCECGYTLMTYLVDEEQTQRRVIL